ncbi:hypothetical protein HRbin02_00961 [Candidatus Calditenuaceae archaeon HR02]|nr:hypothetical protein HRbin02_00961 [Candidatus Calditenuaceae archaeon HR02]
MNRHKSGKVLIDEWVPTGEVGVESVQERIVGQNPVINRLHVWFARRPPVASRAAVLASILHPETTREEFLRLLGIPHDRNVVAAAEKLARAKANKVRLKENPFTWERAFKYTPPKPQPDELMESVREWGHRILRLFNPSRKFSYRRDSG